MTVAVGGQHLSTTVNPGGTWGVSAKTLAKGTYQVVASITDAADNTGTASQVLTIGPAPVTIGSSPVVHKARYRPDAAIRLRKGAIVGAAPTAAPPTSGSRQEQPARSQREVHGAPDKPRRHHRRKCRYAALGKHEVHDHLRSWWQERDPRGNNRGLPHHLPETRRVDLPCDQDRPDVGSSSRQPLRGGDPDSLDARPAHPRQRGSGRQDLIVLIR